MNTNAPTAVTVPATVIRAALQAAASTAGRYCMDAVRIDHDAAARCWTARATDGYMGVVIHFDAAEEPTPGAAYMIPISVAKQIKISHRAVRIVPEEGGTALGVVLNKQMRAALTLPLGDQSSADSFPPLDSIRPEWTAPEHEYTPFPAGFHMAAPLMKRLSALFAAAGAAMHFRPPAADGKPCAVIGSLIEGEGVRALWAIAMPVNTKNR